MQTAELAELAEAAEKTQRGSSLCVLGVLRG
jgi:hypothetical protein